MDFPKTFESTFFFLGQLGSQVIDLAYDYLIGSARRLLRNRKSFHASIALLCEAAMERIVLPYNDGETYNAIGLLSLQSWNYFFEDDYPYHTYQTLLDNDLKRGFMIYYPYRRFYGDASGAGYPNPVRFSPFQYWDALVDTTWKAARARNPVYTGRGEAHDHYYAVEVLPPCIHPLNNEISGGFNDIQTTGYFYNQSEFETQVGNRRVVELQEMETGSPSLTMQMFADLINEAEGPGGEVQYTWDKPYGLSLIELAEYKIAELAYDPGEIDISWIRRCICKGDNLKNYSIPFTARANINLLPLMQFMLACHWANWAWLRPELTVTRKLRGVSRDYLIHADGSTELLYENPFDYESSASRLEWSCRVSMEGNSDTEGDPTDVILEIRFSLEELVRTCPSCLRSAEEIEQSPGWEFEITPEGVATTNRTIIGERPDGLNEDGSIDLEYFDHQWITASTSTEIVVPEDDIHIGDPEGKIVDYPASALIDDGRVKSVAFASALVIDDKFYGYEENEDKTGYVKTRDPDAKGNKARLVVKKSDSVSSDTVKGLIKEFSDSAKAEGVFIGDLEMLPLHDPDGIPASVEGVDDYIPDRAWGWYMTMSDFKVGDKYVPYEFVLAYTGESLVLENGSYNAIRRNCRVRVKSQSVQRYDLDEHFYVKFPYHGAVRAEWNWKAMPVNWR